MRYVLAAVFVYALGAPMACALPALSPNSVSVSKSDPIVHVAKRARAHAQRQNRGDGGIHPLVGSGGY
jgi:hypothetical protein